MWKKGEGEEPRHYRFQKAGRRGKGGGGKRNECPSDDVVAGGKKVGFLSCGEWGARKNQICIGREETLILQKTVITRRRLSKTKRRNNNREIKKIWFTGEGGTLRGGERKGF